MTLLDKVKKSNAEGAGERASEAARSSTASPTAPAAGTPAPRKAVEAAEATIPVPSSDMQMPETTGDDLESLRAVLREDEELIERLLGMLYRVRKLNPHVIAAVSIIEIEKRLGLPREGGTFIFGYLKTKRFIEADDKSRLAITVEGIDYLRSVVMGHVLKGT